MPLRVQGGEVARVKRGSGVAAQASVVMLGEPLGVESVMMVELKVRAEGVLGFLSITCSPGGCEQVQ